MDNKEGKKRPGRRTILIILLVLVLAIVAAVLIFSKDQENETSEMPPVHTMNIAMGDDAPDFEVTTTDGQIVSKAGLLEGKDAVCIVLFATWCGPCEEEFPEMDKVYQRYQDRLGMIAIDVDAHDSEEDTNEYAASHSLSFPIAFSHDLPEAYTTTAYPTTLIIDRNGKAGSIRIGSIPDEKTFEKMISAFIGDDYEETQLGYYSFYAYDETGYVPGVEFVVTTEDGSETYTTGDDRAVGVFVKGGSHVEAKVTGVPDGYKIVDDGVVSVGDTPTSLALPVSKK